jgi:hypothetical protein
MVAKKNVGARSTDSYNNEKGMEKSKCPPPGFRNKASHRVIMYTLRTGAACNPCGMEPVGASFRENHGLFFGSARIKCPSLSLFVFR